MNNEAQKRFPVFRGRRIRPVAKSLLYQQLKIRDLKSTKLFIFTVSRQGDEWTAVMWKERVDSEERKTSVTEKRRSVQ